MHRYHVAAVGEGNGFEEGEFQISNVYGEFPTSSLAHILSHPDVVGLRKHVHGQHRDCTRPAHNDKAGLDRDLHCGDGDVFVDIGSGKPPPEL